MTGPGSGSVLPSQLCVFEYTKGMFPLLQKGELVLKIFKFLPA